MANHGVEGRGARPRWIVWTAWCGLAEVIGMSAAAGAAILGSRLFGEPTTVGAAVGVVGLAAVGGAIEGLAVGGIQFSVLSRWLTELSGRRFVGITVAVAVGAWILGMLPSTIGALAGVTGDASANASEPPVLLVVAAGAVGGAVAGFVFGAAQAWALRGVVTNPGIWVVANVVAWTFAMTVIMLGATTPDADWSTAQVLATGLATGALAGATLGGVTGLFLPALVPSTADAAIGPDAVRHERS